MWGIFSYGNEDRRKSPRGEFGDEEGILLSAPRGHRPRGLQYVYFQVLYMLFFCYFTQHVYKLFLYKICLYEIFIVYD